MRAIVYSVAVAALLSCGNGPTEPLDRREQLALSQARSRWNAAGLASYAFEQRQLCFCPAGLGEWARVTVSDGRVVSVVRPEDGAPIDAAGRMTVPEMFAIVEQLRDAEYLRDIRVDFDAQYSYPTRIEAIAKPNVADGDLTIQARALVEVRD